MQLLKTVLKIWLICALVFPLFLLAEKSVDALKSEVQKRNDELIEAHMANDLKRTLSFFFDDAVLMPDFKPMVQGRNSLAKYYQDEFNDEYEAESAQTYVSEVEIVGDKIIERSTWRLSLKGPGINGAMAFFGSSVSIWKRDKWGKLKMTFTMWNFDHKLTY